MICCLFIQNKQLFDAAEKGRHKDVIQLISEGADHSWMNHRGRVSNIIITLL